MFEYAKHHLKFYLQPDRFRPKLGTSVSGGPQGPCTFVVVCGSSFDIDRPNAASTIRLGYCRAFARLGIGYRFASTLDLAEVLAETNKPFVFLSEFDFEVLTSKARRMLRDIPHFVWVSPSRNVLHRIYEKHGLGASEIRVVAGYARTRVKESGAAFLWAPCPPGGLNALEDWHDSGIPLVSLPQACDDERYFPEPGNPKFEGVELAFVGGYWPAKALQFDKYIRPFSSNLTVFGYSPWPYGKYGGLLPFEEERVLYRNARVCPAISEPHAEVTGDIVERVFKVLGSGGLAVTDAVPHYAEIFGKDELLHPASTDEYRDMVHAALADDSLNARYRAAGLKAILERHTYVHRARKVLELLKIPVPAAA